MSKLFIEQVSKNALLPVKGTTHAAAFDIHCDISDRVITCFDDANNVYKIASGMEPVYIQPNHRMLVPTGWKMRCGTDEAIEFHPRSGLALKAGITMVNCMGLIDADYSDETGLILTNLSNAPFKVNHGERLGQLMVRKLVPTELVVVDELPDVDSNRTGGFGSTSTEALHEKAN